MLNTPNVNAPAQGAISQGSQAVARIRFQPTLFIYLGTSAGQVAYRVKRLLQRAYGDVPVLRHLWVDIDTDIDPLARPYFTASERIELSGLNPAAVVKNIDNYPAIKEWWPDTTVLKAGMLAGGGAPQQMRLVGRLALFRMFNDRTRGPAFIDRLRAATEALFEIENIRATERMSTAAMQYAVEAGCRVVLVFSPAGGTGSAMSFDVAYLCRHLLQGKNPTIISVSVLPAVIDKAIRSETQTQQEKVRANTYAWFKEDNYLSLHPSWNVLYPDGAMVEVAAPPFDYRFVIDIENQAGYRLNSPDDVFNMVAQAIFLDTGSSLAGALRGFTANVAVLGEQFEGARRLYSSLAAASLIYPKERLLQYCANRMARALLDEGLLAEPEAHQVKVSAATVLSQQRLRDADLLADLLDEARVRMHLEPAINRAESVAAAVAQLDAQEQQNQAARQAAVEKLAKRTDNCLAAMRAGVDQELAHLAANQGFLFALAVADLLLKPAVAGAVEAGALSLDGLKTRLAQQGATEADLQRAKDEYAKAREALRKLDDGPEDVLERTLFLKGWKKKFALFKREALTAMTKINDISLELAAQRQAAGIYDQVASLVNGLKAQLNGAVTVVRMRIGELQTTADALASHTHAAANSYEFQQEIEVDFADYYWEHARHITPRAVFAGLIPARAAGKLETLVEWTGQEIKPAAVGYAGEFFVEELNATSLLSTLQAMAEKRGMPAQALIEEELNRLVQYCHPFWQYDRDRGLSDMEGKSIIGVEDENSPLIPAAYRNGTLYEIKTTGFHDRIDVVRLHHGLPAFLIRGMDDFKVIYERRRKGADPLHVLPGMEFAPDLMPERGQRSRQLFAIGLAFDYIVQVGSWYYFDPERGYRSHNIQPGRKFRLAQGREKSEEVFARNEAWARQVDQAVEAEVRAMGNEAAIRKLDEAVEAHRAAIARMPSGDEGLRQQYEREIQAFREMQRRLGRIG